MYVRGVELRELTADAVWPEVVDEVFQDVHHVGTDIVEGNCTVAAAVHALQIVKEFLITCKYTTKTDVLYIVVVQ